MKRGSVSKMPSGLNEVTELPTTVVQPAPPWLSILIPVYNVENFLRECVESVMLQAGSDCIEIILLDDCSTDRSFAMCESLARTDGYAGKVKVMQHSHNQGPSAARNHMLAAASGDYIWFLDSDDYLTNNALTELKKIIDDGAPDLVICDYFRVGYKLKIVSLFNRHTPFKKSFPGRGGQYSNSREKLVEGVFLSRKMYACMKIARRALWTSIEFPVGRLFEDVTAVPYLLLNSHRYYYAQRKWYCYRKTPGSILMSLRNSLHIFDAKKNGDLASALVGYADELQRQFGKISQPVAFAVTHFIAKEFVRIVERSQIAEKWSRANKGKASDEAHSPLRHYRELMETSSPLSFAELKRAYLTRLKLWDYFALSRAMSRTSRDR
jgi:glycosyltransferase involved in cell wall biosynthesis